MSTLVHANKIDEVSRGGALTSIQTRTSERGTGTTSAKLPGSSLEAVKPVLSLRNHVHPCPELWSLCLILRNPVRVTPAYVKPVLISGKSLGCLGKLSEPMQAFPVPKP